MPGSAAANSPLYGSTSEVLLSDVSNIKNNNSLTGRGQLHLRLDFLICKVYELDLVFMKSEAIFAKSLFSETPMLTVGKTQLCVHLRPWIS